MPRTLTCDPALLSRDLGGRVYVVTGANSGSGLATMTQLVDQGAHVVAACRRVDAGREAMEGLTGPGSAEVIQLDLGRLDSVRACAASFLEKHPRLDGLVNNAGVMNTPEGKTADGFETQFGTNHLGHFLLTKLLLDVLKASAPSRIVCVSSVAHASRPGRPAALDLDDLGFERREYSGTQAYSQSKLANVLHALALSRRLAGTGVTAVSLHPGWIRSNLIQHTMPTWVQNVILRPLSGVLGMISIEEGAQTTLHCLLDDDVPNHNGAYYSQSSILYSSRKHRPGGWPMESPNPQARDEQLAEQLYEVSLRMVGLAE